jgi:DMSO/TMAO reductase YedYZ molybdopterin-dependent catalytic subunit
LIGHRFGPGFWRSPLRGPWLTSVLGLVLLCGLPVVMLTGLLSNAAYDPRVGGNVEIQHRSLGPLDSYLFTWPAHPTWLYAVNQGIHISLALALIPVVVVKQWSVLPRLFAWPPFRNPAQTFERLSLIFLIAGIYFEIVTGLLFIEYWVPFHFDFTAAHYYGAWVFFGAFLLHSAIKLPHMRAALATRHALAPLRVDLAHTRPEPTDGAVDSLVSPAPAAPTISRRALLGTVGAGSLLLGVQGVAQDIGGPVRELAYMLPRGSKLGTGPNDFPVNGTFASLGLNMDAITGWRLRIQSSTTGRKLELTRPQLLTMPQHTYWLALACREGWSTTQRWTGVRLRDLAAAVGVEHPAQLDMGALDGGVASLAANQVAAEQSLVALTVNGAPLSLDHGYPARVIVPAEIAINCLNWVSHLSFRELEPPHTPPHRSHPQMKSARGGFATSTAATPSTCSPRSRASR